MAKSGSTFVYVTFIRTTPERLWSVLTDREAMREYWFGSYQECEWRAGSPWRLVFPDGSTADAGEIVECDPPRRLAIKWQNEWKPEMKKEGYSLCTMDIEAVDGATKLTVTHSNEHDGSPFIQAVSGGWPRILSNLKSLIETGEVVFRTKS